MKRIFCLLFTLLLLPACPSEEPEEKSAPASQAAPAALEEPAVEEEPSPPGAADHEKFGEGGLRLDSTGAGSVDEGEKRESRRAPKELPTMMPKPEPAEPAKADGKGGVEARPEVVSDAKAEKPEE